jgi:hypothetical protein
MINLAAVATTLAQRTADYSFQYEYSSDGMPAIFWVFMVVGLALTVIAIAGMWKAFRKAGQPGWAAIIPIYNMYIVIKLAGKPGWWIIWFILPIIPIPIINGILGIVSLVFAFIINIAAAEAFGKGAGFGVGLTLLGFIFWPILGFGDATYQGPKEAAQVAAAPPVQQPQAPPVQQTPDASPTRPQPPQQDQSQNPPQA